MAAVIGALRVNLGMNSTAFLRGVTEAQRKMTDMQRRFARVGAQLNGIGRAMSIGVTAPVVAFGALALRAGGNFEAAMNRVGAVSGATGDALARLRDVAKEMGATTQFSASQAADALGFLAMAGFDAKQAADALPGTLQLAAAAQMDLAQAADIVSNVLSGYGMEVEDLARVNDVLVKTFTSANTDLVQLGEAMKYAGPLAAAAGVAFEESAAAIGLMGNAGIQASMAGTSLRGAIGRILDPTAGAAKAMKNLGLNFTGANGKIVSFDQIIRQLEPHADNAGLFIELFGQRAGPAMAALVSQGADALVDLRGELERAGGTAAAIASAQMQGFNGAMKRLASAFEAVQIAIAESGLLEFATRMADRLAGLLSRLAETNPALLRMGTIIAGVAAVIGPLALVAGAVVTAIGAIGPVAIGVAAALGQAAVIGGVVAAAWKPLSEAATFARQNMLVLSPVIGVLARSMIGALVPALVASAQGLVGLAAAAGARLVAGLKLATAGLWSFKGALISTGIGAIVVGLGYLAQKFSGLVRASGGFKNALIALKAVSVEVAGRIADGWEGVKQKLASVWVGVKASALAAFAGVIGAMPGFVNRLIGAFVGVKDAIIAAWNALPGALEAIGARAINGLIAVVQSGVAALIAPINSVLSAVFLPTIPAPDLSEWRVTVKEAVGVADAASAAFGAAFNADYTGPMSDGLQGMADRAREVSDAAGVAGAALMDAATAPLQSVAALAEAQRMLARDTKDGAGETTDALSEAEAQAEALAAALEDAGSAGSDMGEEAASGARRAADALKDAQTAAQKTGDALAGIGGNFVQNLVNGDAQDAFKNLFSDFKNLAAQSFGDVIKTSFSAGGGGIGGVFQSLSASWTGVTAGVSSLFAGGGFAALGGALSAAMPLIGAGIAIFNLIKGFSKRELIGSGLKFGVKDGAIKGGSYKRFDVSTFWGLFHHKKTEVSPFDQETIDAFQAQIDGIQAGVGAAFKTLGISVSGGFLDSINFAVREIETKGLSEDEAARLVGEVFADYGDALARAVGNITLNSVQTLAQVQAALDPVAKTFDIFAASVVDAATVLDLAPFAQAAENLAALSGGVDAFAQKSAAFFEAFYSDAEKLDVMRRRVDETFADLGIEVPQTDQAFRDIVTAQDLMTEAGQKTYATLLGLAPIFDTVTDATENFAAAILNIRGAYQLDAQGFATEWEAKLADELGNPDRYSQELITAQNEELAAQSSLLDEIRRELIKQGQTARDGLTFGQLI